jgi:glycosyltransferase involved in cell wall biosynthesis
MPRVSVIIPTYNRVSLLPRAINSVLAQTYHDVEIIVVDDGSTDNTIDVLESYGDQIICVRQANQERSIARNQGIDQSSGQYIAFLDDDDWWHPEKLSKQISTLEECPQCDFICCYSQQITPSGDVIGSLGRDVACISKSHDALSWFYLGYSIPTLTAVVSRKVIEKVGLFDPKITYIEDWEFWMRVAIETQMICIPETLAYYQLQHRYMPKVFDLYGVQDGRIYVLEKIQKIVENLGSMDRLHPSIIARGYARAWWYGSLIDSAVNSLESALQRAIQSYRADPTFFSWSNVNNAREMLIGFSTVLIETGTMFDESQKFIRQVFSNLPAHMKRLFKERVLIADLYAWHGHLSYAKCEYQQAVRMMKSALFLNPSLVMNRGILAVMVKSMMKHENID